MIRLGKKRYQPKDTHSDYMYSNEEVKMLIDYAKGTGNDFSFLDSLTGKFVIIKKKQLKSVEYI